MSNAPSSSQLHHIVIAGGCHVNGWPIGGASSFVQVMLQGDPYADPSTFSPINLRNCSSLLCHLRQQPTDALILQLGNYETLASVKKHFRSILHLSRSHRHSGSHAEESSGRQLNPDSVFPTTPSWRLRVIAKKIYGHSVGHIHPPLFDADGFRRRSEQLLGELAQLQTSAPPLVVFLSPIPCADPLISQYRRQAGHILDDLCRSAPADIPFRLRYLDTSQALGIGADAARALNTGIFADDLHLNRKGHQLLGDALASILHDAPYAVQQQPMKQLLHI